MVDVNFDDIIFGAEKLGVTHRTVFRVEGILKRTMWTADNIGRQ